ncbi:HET-domain-containing protein [Ophiobolus disseminans]|uniref:HET-domain-containing protein n=1 Tax=Ophiobolus disseminans TaxID=1469910 RepID=A0A6A6ZPR1_9PLEO|nr:HET-domain-containing protein [Ophiobolus disseminans]
MPARLLKVGSSSDGHVSARIVATSEHGVHAYLTLSYCWGGDQTHKTTEKSLSDTEGKIDIMQLPKTIQDAITVTVNLGYGFLWVDSVCIIQDNELDRTTEIAKMPEIYSNAVCTIAASSPANCGRGFLNDHDYYTEHAIRIRLRRSEGLVSDIVHAYPYDHKNFVVEPLATRAWSLQERLLSTRILEFRRNQVHYLCPSTGQYDKSRSDGWKQDWLPRRQFKPLGSSNNHHPETLLGWKIPTTEHFRHMWYSLIEMFTKRDLTFPTDRTLAISGIAQRLAAMDESKSCGTYIVGHWISSDPHNLMWAREGPNEVKDQQQTRRYPTWAWTSVECQVICIYMVYHQRRSVIEPIDYAFKLRDANAPFGDVKSATITTKGRMITAECQIHGSFAWKGKLFTKLAETQIGDAILDTIPELVDSRFVCEVTLLLTESSGGRCPDLAGLILVEDPSHNGRRRFSRLGIWVVTAVYDQRQLEQRSHLLSRLFGESGMDTFDLV